MTSNHIQLITDGTAYLPAARLRELDIISLPIVAEANGKHFMYDQQTHEHLELLQELDKSRSPVKIVGPSPDDFRAVFERTLYRTNKMLVILSSSHLSPIMRNARIAARDFMGRCDITILDSQTISVGLGLLVEKAGELLKQGDMPLGAYRQVHSRDDSANLRCDDLAYPGLHLSQWQAQRDAGYPGRDAQGASVPRH